MSPLVTPRAPAEPVRSAPTALYEGALGRLAIAAGLTFSIIGLTDVGLLLFPTNFGSPEWEFATIGQIFEALTITVLGFGLLAAGVVARGNKIAKFATGLFFTFFTLAILGGRVIFGLDAPVALRGTPVVMSKPIQIVIFKNSVLGLVYFALFFYFASACFKSRKPRAY